MTSHPDKPKPSRDIFDTPIVHVPGQMPLFSEEELMEPGHTPTRCTGTVPLNGGTVTYDYVGCSVCRIDHPVIGPNIPQPWERAHPDPLPATASQPIPDGHNVRQ